MDLDGGRLLVSDQAAYDAEVDRVQRKHHFDQLLPQYLDVMRRYQRYRADLPYTLQKSLEILNKKRGKTKEQLMKNMLKDKKSQIARLKGKKKKPWTGPNLKVRIRMPSEDDAPSPPPPPPPPPPPLKIRIRMPPEEEPARKRRKRITPTIPTTPLVGPNWNLRIGPHEKHKTIQLDVSDPNNPIRLPADVLPPFFQPTTTTTTTTRKKKKTKKSKAKTKKSKTKKVHGYKFDPSWMDPDDEEINPGEIQSMMRQGFRPRLRPEMIPDD